MNTPTGKRFIPLDLNVEIGVDEFRVTPHKVFMIASKSPDPPSAKVKLEFLTDVVLTAIAATSDDALPLRINVSRLSENTYMIDLTVDRQELQSASLAIHKSQLVIRPEGLTSPKEIALPLSLFVRQ